MVLAECTAVAHLNAMASLANCFFLEGSWLHLVTLHKSQLLPRFCPAVHIF